jgi:hypothetical protein
MNETLKPIPLTITCEGSVIRVHGSVFDITILQTLAQRSDRTAIKNIQRVFQVDRDTAKVLMHAARKDTP